MVYDDDLGILWKIPGHIVENPVLFRCYGPDGSVGAGLILLGIPSIAQKASVWGLVYQAAM